MTDQALEDRLRRDLATIAELPLGRLEPLPTRPRPVRQPARIIVIAGIAAALLIAATIVALTGRSHGPVTVTAPQPIQLPVPHGKNEPLVRSSLVYDDGSPKAWRANIAVEVNGIAFTDHVGQGLNSLMLSPGGGEGIDASTGEDTTSPADGKQLTIWVGLPANAAVITYTYHGTTVWQRPVDHIAAFAHSPVTTFRDTPAGTKNLAGHPSFDPLLRAYDADGNLLTQFVVYVGGPLTGLSDIYVKKH